MNILHTRCTLLVGAVALTLTAGCSRDTTEPVATATDEATSAISKEIWVDGVQLSSTAGTVSQDGYRPGETLELSMSVEDAPRGTVVTTYWYGPEGRQLAYESQTVDADDRQMSFQQENTHAWAAGTYRAEVWVGDNKVEEETFKIVSG